MFKNIPFFSKTLPIQNRSGECRIITDIEGGNIHNVQMVKNNHFSMEIKPEIPSIYKIPNHHFYWFYFKAEGLENKTVRFDITNCRWMRTHWRNYKPVFSASENPDSLTQTKWEKINNTSLWWKTFSFQHKFKNDTAWIALRYPYNYSRLKNLVSKNENTEFLDIEDLGFTRMGNSIYLLMITDKRIPNTQKKAILIYAREHGVEQDGSWVAEGMIDFLLSSHPQAVFLRKICVFLIIPIIAPDAIIHGRTTDPNTGSFPGVEFSYESMESVEAGMVYRRVEKLVNQGTPLDICISLHNPHGTEPNIYSYFRTCASKSLLKKCHRFHDLVLKNAKEYTHWKIFIQKKLITSVGRFARDFDAVSIVYEVNHQAKDNYLSVDKLKNIGRVILQGSAEYYGYDQSR
ncbi:MAG: M14-type cytosolic carboxypeptidase [Pseudomonadota bacterium]